MAQNLALIAPTSEDLAIKSTYWKDHPEHRQLIDELLHEETERLEQLKAQKFTTPAHRERLEFHLTALALFGMSDAWSPDEILQGIALARFDFPL